ncbi:Glutamate receptor 2 [Portunus trituberculatus]|uniref:Glutamate receptor 2 n=1 Tax=Portunus trituberculatus TaxID=210409 RepID=A0A5B7JH10_PORTR|nr:Glutamate receptor 2 [Portunus trituberculatus]
MSIQDIAQTEPTLKNGGLVWLYVLRPMLSHALPRLPVTHSQRVFVAAWWLTSLILTTAYTANLIAFLTIPLYPKKLQTVEELAESNYRSIFC